MSMTKGFPRPRKLIKQIRVKGQGRYKGHDWSKWDNKIYPIPYTARMDRIGHLCDSRVVDCKVNRNCIVCGDKVTDKYPLAYVWFNTFAIDAGPFHENCMKLTQLKCPVVNERPQEFRFIRTTWKALESRTLPVRHIRAPYVATIKIT